MALDPSYTGNWYCAKTEVCEQFIETTNRECVISKGCATEEQCACSTCSNTGYAYDSSDSDNGPLKVNSNYPAGFKINLYCCEAAIFPDDDLISINYDDICNSATKNSYYTSFIVMSFATVLFLLLY